MLRFTRNLIFRGSIHKDAPKVINSRSISTEHAKLMVRKAKPQKGDGVPTYVKNGRDMLTVVDTSNTNHLFAVDGENSTESTYRVTGVYTSSPKPIMCCDTLVTPVKVSDRNLAGEDKIQYMIIFPKPVDVAKNDVTLKLSYDLHGNPEHLEFLSKIPPQV